VEIQNDDNNYANGFMTQHSRVMLRQCWLAPVKVWEEFDQLRDRWKFSKHNWPSDSKSFPKYYAGLRNFVFDNFMPSAYIHFPNIKQQPETDNSSCNHQYHPRFWKENPGAYWVGSSGHYRLTLVKKLGFWRHSTDRRRGFWKLSKVKNVRDLYDKYKQYEDTRNTDQ